MLGQQQTLRVCRQKLIFVGVIYFIALGFNLVYVRSFHWTYLVFRKYNFVKIVKFFKNIFQTNCVRFIGEETDICFWSDGYFVASTGEASSKIIYHYIKNQGWKNVAFIPPTEDGCGSVISVLNLENDSSTYQTDSWHWRKGSCRDTWRNEEDVRGTGFFRQSICQNLFWLSQGLLWHRALHHVRKG